MKLVPIPEARRLANNADATRILIVYLNDAGEWGFTTYAKTKRQCTALGRWADENVLHIAVEIEAHTGGAA